MTQVSAKIISKLMLPSVAALAFSYGGNAITFAPYCLEWHMLRKILAREMLSNSNLDASYTLRKNEAKKRIRDMYGKVGTVINVLCLQP